MRHFLLLLVGITLLIFSGYYLVRGSVSIARRFRISTLVVGMTVVAFGTSAPELLVSLRAALLGYHDISVYNVIGSNIANIGLVLAVTAIFRPIPVNRTSVVVDWPVMMGSSLLLYLFVLNRILGSFEGFVFVLLLTVFVFFSVRVARRKGKNNTDQYIGPKLPLLFAVIMIVASCAGLAYGADLLIGNAVVIARFLGVSERVISVSLVALGTSVPELAASGMASIRRESDISIGNIIGSNIFNIFSVLGITSLVRPVAINPRVLEFDIFWLLGIALMLFLFMMPANSSRIGRSKGVAMLMVYIVYLVMLYGLKL